MSNIYPIAIPKWGIEMVEGTIAAWKKSLGEAIAKGDEILEIESDKIVNVWESPTDGILRRVLVADGETRQVGELLGVIATADTGDAEIDAFIASFSGGKAAPAATTGSTVVQAAGGAGLTPGSASAEEAARRINPVVRRRADELGVNLDNITGSGRNGRITTEDVEAAARHVGMPSASSPSADYDVIALSATRKTIGKRLVEAKQNIPHYYLTREYELDNLLRHRQRLNDAGGARVSLNDLLVWCVARALLKEPRVNVNVVNDAIHQFRHAHVAVAIATENGLYPATLRSADTLSAREIAAATASLAEKARAGTLTREDISGASFTVSNLGMYGVSTFCAIINPPMGAILALGKAQQRPLVRDGKIELATLVNATLSCDHRVIDGAIGGRFLAALAEEIAGLD